MAAKRAWCGALAVVVLIVPAAGSAQMRGPRRPDVRRMQRFDRTPGPNRDREPRCPDDGGGSLIGAIAGGLLGGGARGAPGMPGSIDGRRMADRHGGGRTDEGYCR